MDLTIEKLVYGGEGLARMEGQVVFTPFVLPGESVEVAPPSSQKHAQRADLLRVVQPSTDRVAAPCPIFGKCGGCHYQHADYPAQLQVKRGILAETLRRGAKIEIDEARIAITSGDPWGYRNRTQFHIENGQIGFRRMRSQKLVPAAQCPISSPKINEALAKLNRMVKDRRWPRFVSSLEIFTDETQVQWNVQEATQPVAKHFFEWLAAEIPGTVPGALDYEVNGDVFSIAGNSFFQVNRSLIGCLADLAFGEASGASAWDLYAGAGVFAARLAEQVGPNGSVTAVESARDAVDDAATALLDLAQVHPQAGRVERVLAGLAADPDVVVLDPPRAGAGKEVVAAVTARAPQRIVHVGCDPASFARDLSLYLGAGYRITGFRAFDAFPLTHHVEAIALLTR